MSDNNTIQPPPPISPLTQPTPELDDDGLLPEVPEGVLDEIESIEDPVVSFIGRPAHELPDDELDAILDTIRELSQKPGAMSDRLKDESVAIKTKAPRVAKKKSNIASVSEFF